MKQQLVQVTRNTENLVLLAEALWRIRHGQYEKFRYVNIPRFPDYREKRKGLNINGITKQKQALKIIVSLSQPSKMPTFGYSLSTLRCQTGKKLAKIEGTTCNTCYAGNGNSWYLKPHVYKIHEKRYKALHHKRWVDAMVFIIKYKGLKLFRWHDSGDIQGTWHLDKIVEIAKRVPETLFWLPTTEWEIVRKYIKVFGKEIPKNLIIRLSALKVGQRPPVELAKELGIQTSSVSKDKHTCPAHEQGDKCLDCTNCWNRKKQNIVYLWH